MVTMRGNLQCEVCGAKTLIRIQVGWLDMHPIRFNCGKCGILITGTMYQDQLNVNAHTEFDNVKKVPDKGDSDFHIEVSGELLTEKLQPYKFKNTLFPPFFTSGIWMMDEGMGEFKERTLRFLSIIKNDWPKYRRVNELWFNGNYQYLRKDLKKQISNKQFPLNNELQYLIAIRQTNIRLLSSILSENFFEKQIKFIGEEVSDLKKNKDKEFLTLIEYFSTSIHRNEEKIFECIKQFIEKFRFMIPVFGIEFYKNGSQTELYEKGITTVSFEELKQFYVDVYEVITEMLELIVAYNNLKYRGNFQLMKEKRKDVVTLDDYKKKNKGAKLEFVDGNEEYDNIVYPYLNNKLRNAIGHNTYKMDIQSQQITYFPKGTEDNEDHPVISLKDFTRSCWDIFQSLMNLSELVYQTRKVYYLNQDLKPAVEHIYEEKAPSKKKKKKQNSKRNSEKQKRESRKKNRK
ncbi:metal-binding protein [Neobacillus niacini]|uniref:metal-binding protein n=1 Tax=Neobacillus niacini TaxID=86668 RepID=UPI0021CB5562|nr:metal-binding protein [Neobacillus niacini]MCM3768130.1 metal-binding protein [Neobacillus niacini]